jgi:hypothetical protein
VLGTIGRLDDKGLGVLVHTLHNATKVFRHDTLDSDCHCQSDEGREDLAEIDRAVRDLRMRGILLYTNLAGRFPDELEFRDERLRVGDFEIDIVYKRLLVNEYLPIIDQYPALLQACRAGAARRWRRPDAEAIPWVSGGARAADGRDRAPRSACLARAASARGEVPFLHVYPNNPAAALYTRLGFVIRATLWVLWRRPLAVEART